MPRTILYVRGFHPSTRARDLAYEFERYGPLVRCDIPAPRTHSGSNPYAFVEFRSYHHAEDAYSDMHGRHFEGYRLTVEWAKKLPSSLWRTGGRAVSPPRRPYARDRSRSPRRGDRDFDRDRDRDRRDRKRSRSRSMDRNGNGGHGDDIKRARRDDSRERRRSASPNGRVDEKTTTPPDGFSQPLDKALTPPLP